MRLSRLVPALAAGALLVATTAPATAQEAEPLEGVGTTTGSLTLLGLDAGELLALDLLSDAGIANIDEGAGAKTAAAQIAAFALSSELLDIAQSVPLLAVESNGAEQRADQDVAIPANPVVSGAALPLSLSALVGDDGARSGLSGQLADLDVLGGVLGLTGVDLGLAGDALEGDATASRTVAVQDLEVLDLEDLLAALGIPLTDLPLDTVLGLLDGLGLLDQLPLDALGIDLDDLSADALLGVVDGLLGQVDPLAAQVDTLTGQITELTTARSQLSGTTGQTCTTVVQPVIDLLGNLGSTVTEVCTDVTATLTTITSQITSLQATLTQVQATLQPLLDQLRGLLTGPTGALGLLGGTSLLSIDGLDVEVLTKATDQVATSVSEVNASLGAVNVGELPALGALDLGAPTTQVDALLGQVEGAIGGVLGQIAPSLSDLVSVSTLQEQTSVVEEAGKVLATAEFTGLVVEVQPVLAEIEALLAGLAGVESLGDTLQGLGLPVPTSGATEVLAVNQLVAPVTDGLPLLGGIAALDEVLSLQVASVRQQSVFAASAVPATPGTPGAPGQTPGQAPAPTLPRTGSSDTLVLGLAMAAAVVALGGRQLLRRNAG